MTECRDSYVVTCNPQHPATPLPDCEDGWEIGNGTAVCATQQPSSVPLAATGADATGLAAGGAVLALVGLYTLALVAWRRRRDARAERDRKRWAAALEEESNGFQ